MSNTQTIETPNDRLRSQVPAVLVGAGPIDALIARLHLVEFKGDLPQCRNLTLYKRHGGDMNAELFIERHTPEATTMYKYPEAFRVLQKLELRREDPRTPSLESLGPWVVDKRKAYMICRIMASPDDNVRVLFADPESIVIQAICCPDMEAGDYNDLDVGKFMISKSKGVGVCNPAEEYTEVQSLPELGALSRNLAIRTTNGYPNSYNCYGKLRATYISDFVKRRYKDIQLKCFKFTRTSLSYSDTVIAASWEAIQKAAAIVEGSYHADFTTLFTEVLKGAYGHEFVVNGVPVTVTRKTSQGQAAVLHYVNNHRISAPDLSEVLTHALCFPNAPDVYEDYLVTVSKVSLKFHKAVNEGLDFVMHTNYLDHSAEGEARSGPEIRRPGDGTNDSDRGRLCIKLRVNKVFGKKMNFDFAGRTRFVDEFDAFVRVAGKHLRKRCVTLPSVSADLPHHGLLTRLTMIDNDLTSESRFMSAMELDSYTGYIDTPGNREIAERLYREFSAAFAAGINNEYNLLARSHELLQQVMADTGAQCVQNAEDRWVYKVTGISGTRYVVDEESAAVHLDSGAGGDHICIVKANNDIRGYDYISSLLMALAQDKFTARNISTLQTHVNKAKAA